MSQSTSFLQWRYLGLITTLLLLSQIQSKPDYYDPQPFPMGSKVTKQNAASSCKMHNRRICSKTDLLSVYVSGRYSCEPSWVYDNKLDDIVGSVVINYKNKCFQDAFYILLSPLLPTSSSQHVPYVYYCKDKKNQYHPDDCTGNGKDYQGTKSKTWTGRQCQAWGSSYPHKHDEIVEYSAFNFCRNPSGKVLPYCYLSWSDSSKWEYCSVSCRNYGKSDGCKIIMYHLINYRGASCIVETKKGTPVYFDVEKDCNLDVVKSIEIKGSFCAVAVDILITSSDPHIKNDVKSGYVMETNNDVILVNTTDQIPDAVERFGYHLCSIEEVEDAENFEDATGKKKRSGHVKGNTIYYYGVEKPQKKKNSWCCHDPHPEYTDNHYYFYEVNDKVCSSLTRNESMWLRDGKELNYTIRKRVCLEVEVISITPPVGPCYVFKNGYPIGYRSSTFKLRVCCCDVDCFPINYFCSSNDDCCTGMCVKGLCYAEGVKPFEHTLIDVDDNLSPEMIALIVIISLFVMSYFMRLCCPERKLVSNQIKIHDD